MSQCELRQWNLIMERVTKKIILVTIVSVLVDSNAKGINALKVQCENVLKTNVAKKIERSF